MANIRMIFNDGIRQGVLSATSEAMPISNVQDERRAFVWRSEDTSGADATDQEISAVMPITINGLGGVVLSNTNLTMTADAAVTIKNGMADIGTLEMICLARNTDGTTTWVAWFDDGPVDQVEISISDPSNPDGYLQIVQIMAGAALTFEYCFSAGAEQEWVEDVEHFETDGSTIRSEGTGQDRRRSLINLELLPEADRAAFVDAALQHGQKLPLFLSMYPEWGGTIEAQHQYICKRITNIKNQHWIKRFFRGGVEFREV